MRHARLHIVAAILVCLATTSFATGRTRAERWRAPAGTREILMNHREAQGLGDHGKEKLKGFSAIRVTRKITRSGAAAYNNACEAKEPDRIRMESGTGAVVINTASMRIETDTAGTVNRRPLTPYHDSVIAMCLVPPSKSATSEKVRMIGKERVDGKPAYHMLAIDDVGQYDEWIDAANYTLVQRKQSGVILNTVEQWTDFRNVSGLMVPFDHFTRNTSTLNPWTEDEALTRFDFDPQINDADFSAEATKPTMTGSATSGSAGTPTNQPSGSVISGNIGGQNVSVNVNDALATLSGRQPAAQATTSQPASGTANVSSGTPAAESQSTTSNNTQATVANQVAQAAKDPNATVAAAQAAAANKQVPSGVPGPSVVRQIGHGQIISPACSDATNLVAIDEVSTGYKDPSADMRFTVTNIGTEELYVDRVNCKEVSRMKPRDSKRCIYASKSGWVVVVAKSKDIFNPSSGGANTCGEGFNALTTMQESKLGVGK
ncbi:MAG: hypothetical protein HYX28_09990 [Candidatus Koribacter versatilis]|uniref:Uncharacterized protein n=1 Tax=Candidatus Korobacter versatilis TaxID=658062 RepID=A0A932A9G2_9BACT|nr:hypothetical protein [Candidatus Koribacter versatilis]